MITDNLNFDWLVDTNDKADLYMNGDLDIDQFTNDQLQYLVYWNFGISGANYCQWAANAEAELNARGQHANSQIAEQIEDIVRQYY